MLDSHEPDRLLVIVVEKNKEVFRQAPVHYTSVICDALTGIQGSKMHGRARGSSSPEGQKCKWAMAHHGPCNAPPNSYCHQWVSSRTIASLYINMYRQQFLRIIQALKNQTSESATPCAVQLHHLAPVPPPGHMKNTFHFSCLSARRLLTNPRWPHLTRRLANGKSYCHDRGGTYQMLR